MRLRKEEVAVLIEQVNKGKRGIMTHWSLCSSVHLPAGSQAHCAGTHTHTHAHTHSHTHTHSHNHTHIHTRTLTQPHTHTHTRTHTHTHTQAVRLDGWEFISCFSTKLDLWA